MFVSSCDCRGRTRGRPQTARPALGSDKIYIYICLSLSLSIYIYTHTYIHVCVCVYIYDTRNTTITSIIITNSDPLWDAGSELLLGERRGVTNPITEVGVGSTRNHFRCTCTRTNFRNTFTKTVFFFAHFLLERNPMVHKSRLLPNRPLSFAKTHIFSWLKRFFQVQARPSSLQTTPQTNRMNGWTGALWIVEDKISNCTSPPHYFRYRYVQTASKSSCNKNDGFDRFIGGELCVWF